MPDNIFFQAKKEGNLNTLDLCTLLKTYRISTSGDTKTIAYFNLKTQKLEQITITKEEEKNIQAALLKARGVTYRQNLLLWQSLLQYHNKLHQEKIAKQHGTRLLTLFHYLTPVALIAVQLIFTSDSRQLSRLKVPDVFFPLVAFKIVGTIIALHQIINSKAYTKKQKLFLATLHIMSFAGLATATLLGFKSIDQSIMQHAMFLHLWGGPLFFGLSVAFDAIYGWYEFNRARRYISENIDWLQFDAFGKRYATIRKNQFAFQASISTVMLPMVPVFFHFGLAMIAGAGLLATPIGWALTAAIVTVSAAILINQIRVNHKIAALQKAEIHDILEKHREPDVILGVNVEEKIKAGKTKYQELSESSKTKIRLLAKFHGEKYYIRQAIAEAAKTNYDAINPKTLDNNKERALYEQAYRVLSTPNQVDYYLQCKLAVKAARSGFNAYLTLKLDDTRNASKSTIKSKYEKLKNEHKDNQAQLKQLELAYDILYKDTSVRSEYDLNFAIFNKIDLKKLSDGAADIENKKWAKNILKKNEERYENHWFIRYQKQTTNRNKTTHIALPQDLAVTDTDASDAKVTGAFKNKLIDYHTKHGHTEPKTSKPKNKQATEELKAFLTLDRAYLMKEEISSFKPKEGTKTREIITDLFLSKNEIKETKEEKNDGSPKKAKRLETVRKNLQQAI